MRRARVIVGLSSLVALGIVLAQGCQDPTQVTLDIALTERAQCAEIPRGTAISVGVDPADIQARVETGFVTATTNACDASSRKIGTLVITPADPGRASVIVIVGYRRDPTECRPPLFEGCIVARRYWAFPKSRPLRVPITVDPQCADVPCDAFSTCRNGLCFSAQINTDACDGDTCPEPGATADGGTNPDAAVEVDGFVPPDARPDGPLVLLDSSDDGEGPNDGGSDADGGPQSSLPRCSTDANKTLFCLSAGLEVSCSMQTCCDGPSGAHVCNPAQGCSGDRYCCQDSDCGGGDACQFGIPPAINNAGRCRPKVDAGPDGGTIPYCLNDDLYCKSADVPILCGPPGKCCDTAAAAATCNPVVACTSARFCCVDASCDSDAGQVCMRSAGDKASGKPGTCGP